MSEKDPIKAYIDRHRPEFDDLDPPAGLWDRVEADLPGEVGSERMVPLRRVLQIAAGIAIVLSVALWSLLREEAQPGIPVAREVLQTNPMEDYPELAEASLFYQTRIEEANRELESFNIDPENLESLELLETEMESLRRELGGQVEDERLVEAMIQLYRYKLQTLEDMLDHLKNENNEKDEDIRVVPL